MGTVSEDVANIQSLMTAASDAATDTNDSSVISAMSAVTSAVQPCLDNPTTFDQSAADAAGSALRTAHDGRQLPYPDYEDAVQQLHCACEQAFSAHRSDLDWDGAAGNDRAQPEPQSGFKHKPS